MKELLTLVLAALVFRTQSSSSPETTPCHLMRSDYVTCSYGSSSLSRAGPNEFSIHRTVLRESQGGFFECLVRRNGQYIGSISGTEELKIIYSPGYLDIDQPQGEKLLTEYNIQCPSDELLFLNLTHLNIQPTDCPVADEKCELVINRGVHGITELCNEGTHSLLESNAKISLYSKREQYQFIMFAVCFKPEESNLAGCSEYTEKGPVYEAFTDTWTEAKECRNNSTRFQEIDVRNNNLVYMNGAIVITAGTNHLSVVNDIVLLHILCNYDEVSLHTQNALDSDGRPKVFRGSGTLTVVGNSAYLLLTDEFPGNINSCNPVIRALGRAYSTLNFTSCSNLFAEPVNSVFSVSAVAPDEFEVICTPHTDTVSDEWNCSAHCRGPHTPESLMNATSGVNTSLTITLKSPCDGFTCYCNVTATVGEHLTSGQVLFFSSRENVYEHSGCSLDDLTTTPEEVNELCLSVPNGLVCYSDNSTTSVAVYMCSEGYSLVGDSERVCQSSGNWGGAIPQCTVEEGSTEEKDGQLSSATMVSITAVLCTLIFFVIGALIGALLYHLIRRSTSSKPTNNSDAVSEIYDELPTPTIKQGGIPMDEKSQDINTLKNESYGQATATPDTPRGIYESIYEASESIYDASEKGAAMAVESPQEIETSVNDAYGQRAVLAAVNTAQPVNEEHAV